MMINRLQSLVPSLGNLFLDFPAADLPAASSPVPRASKFAVSCAGDAEYPEDIAIFGTYTIEGTVDLGACGSIGEAIAMVELRMARGDIDPDDDEAVSFRPSLFKIVDDDQRLVLAGEPWRGGIRWCTPVATDDEAKQVVDDVRRLRSEASFEAGWDNHCTARSLRRQASVFAGRLVDPLWRNAARAALSAAA